ncbi:MAG: S8 family serine peptidase [Acidobacteria bacterium]|nr:S8 family serine peptidase [Acidobacteriota bacterium]
MDRALSIHRVLEAWTRLEPGAPGAGVKIGVLDTGIEHTHPAFQDATMAPPKGYPKGATHFTTNKIIVARTYGEFEDLPEDTPMDLQGHGTATAMVAGGSLHQSIVGPLSGVAHKAYLGNYKVFAGDLEIAGADAVLKGMDDAVADGMDVLNVSLGMSEARNLENDIVVAGVERAAEAGVIVVVPAGNIGPNPNTISSPGSAPSAIGVGATWNDRIFTGVLTAGNTQYIALPLYQAGLPPLTGALAAVDTPSEALCRAASAGDLSGRIALIPFGGCRIELKLLAAERAGAAGVAFYADVSNMSWEDLLAGSMKLPSVLLLQEDGLALKRRLDTGERVDVTLNFGAGPVPAEPDRIAFFSGRGPGPDLAIKPDMVAVGLQVLAAVQSNTPGAPLYSPAGYLPVQGTSFSAPLVAGAAAVLRGARPGLTVQQYRSLLINSARPLPLPVQFAGAGSLDLAASLRATITAYPSSISFGAGGDTVDSIADLWISNAGAAAASYTASVRAAHDGPAPTVSPARLTIDPGGFAKFTVSWRASGLQPGEYEGALEVRDSSGAAIRVPYWYGVASGEPKYLTLLSANVHALQGSDRAIAFRVTDAAGIAIADVEPSVTVLGGGGEVVRVEPIGSDIPGAWMAVVRIGTEDRRNIVRIDAAGMSRIIVIEGVD